MDRNSLALGACRGLVCLLALVGSSYAATWNKLELGDHQACGFYHVSGKSNDAVYFGRSGAILKYDGASLVEMTRPAGSGYVYDLHADLALSTNASGKLSVLQASGTAWSALAIPDAETTTWSPKKLWASDDHTQIVALVSGGRQVRYEDGSWKYYGPDGYYVTPYDIMGAADGSYYYYVMGTTSSSTTIFYRYRDSGWKQKSKSTLSGGPDVWYIHGRPLGDSIGEIYGVKEGSVRNWLEGSPIWEMSHPLQGEAGARFNGIVEIDGDLYAYGKSSYTTGFIFKLVNGAWTDVTPAGISPVHQLWGRGGDLYAAADCQLWHYGTPIVKPERRPVLVIPGVYGSYIDPGLDFQLWNLHRGVHPEQLVLDPLARGYDDLVQTLQNVGYTLGKDLFPVPYDWRLNPGPIDGSYDGVLDGLTGYTITDKNLEYGVDYLGYQLRQAVKAWETHYPGVTLDKVDIITHSTGGLVARSYIQSGAYGAKFNLGGGKKANLPKVENLFLVAVPNRGAAGPWQAMHNNFIEDRASMEVLSKIIDVAYQKVRRGKTITGFPAPITKQSISVWGTDREQKVEFIRQYVPTFRALLATYDFLYDKQGNLVDVNDDPNVRNDLLLDLNNGLDAVKPDPSERSPFVAKVGKTTVFYSDDLLTENQERYMDSNTGYAVLFPFDAYAVADAVYDNRVWYKGQRSWVGDGTVPKISSVGQFLDDSRVRKIRVAVGSHGHTALPSNATVQKTILNILGAKWSNSDISTSLAGVSRHALWAAWIDPVDMLLVDSKGRRFGYLSGSGPITEIPGSVWFGGNDGIGWINSEVDLPLTVQLSGQGGDYAVGVSGLQGKYLGGFEKSGNLATGKRLQADIKLRSLRPPTATIIAPLLLD